MLEKLKEQIKRLEVYATDVNDYGDGYLKGIESCLQTIKNYDPWIPVTPETMPDKFPEYDRHGDAIYLGINMYTEPGFPPEPPFTVRFANHRKHFPGYFETVDGGYKAKLTHYMPLPLNPKQ